MHSYTSEQSVAVCLCTYRRPKLLRECLESLGCQIAPPSVRPMAIIVENDPELSAHAIADAFSKIAPFPVHYQLEPVIGIASARNRALESALANKAECVAFLDDDEIAEPDWLANLMAPEFLHAPILVGYRFYTYTGPAAYIQDNELANGGADQIVSASNVRISAAVIRHGLRFDTSGSPNRNSDTQFFCVAEAAGFRPQWTNRAMVTNQAVLTSFSA